MTAVNAAVLHRYRRKRLTRRIAAVVIGIAVTLVLLEVLLRVLDPFGVVYFHDLANNFYNIAEPDPRGYRVPAGEHHPAHWSFTILEDGTRAVPSTNTDAERTLVFVGDSVAFGYGVNDDETFVDLIARELPGWRVINDSMPGWNIQNIERAWEMHPDADLIFVTTIPNDLYEPMRTHENRNVLRSYVELYANVVSWLIVGYPLPTDEQYAAHEPEWLASITRIAADERVRFVLFGTEMDYNLRVAGMFPKSAIMLPLPKESVSMVDPHKNPTGHRVSAETLLPHVQARVAEFEAVSE